MKGGGVTELVEGADYFVLEKEKIAEFSKSLNPALKWVVVAEEDFKTLQEENVALMEYIIRKDL